MKPAWGLHKITFAAFLCFIIGIAGIVFLVQEGALSDETVPVDIEKTADGTRIEALSISSDTADISFVKSPSNELKIRLTGHVLQAEHKHTDILLEEKGNGTGLEAVIRTGRRHQIGINLNELYHLFQRGFTNDLKVVVELPDKVYRSIEVKTDTGEISLPPLQSETLSLNSDTGDITLEEFSGRLLSAGSDTGTMRLRKITSEVKLDSDTGDFYLDMAGLPEDISLRTDTGDIQLTLGQEFPLVADFASDTGKTTVNAGSGAFDFETKEKHKLRGKLGAGGPLVKARTDTGDITLSVK